MTDMFTRYIELVALPSTNSALVARALVENIICRHGCPHVLLSDRGSSFLSKTIYELCSILHISKINTSSYHPQTNGIVERSNASIKMILSTFVYERYLNGIYIFHMWHLLFVITRTNPLE